MANIGERINLKGAVVKMPQIVNKVDGDGQEWFLMIIISPDVERESCPQTTPDMVLNLGHKYDL